MTLGALYNELKDAMTKADFRELREAQNRTDARLDLLTETVADLCETQKRRCKA